MIPNLLHAIITRPGPRLPPPLRRRRAGLLANWADAFRCTCSCGMPVTRSALVPHAESRQSNATTRAIAASRRSGTDRDIVSVSHIVTTTTSVVHSVLIAGY